MRTFNVPLHSEEGSALIYILIAIALLGALTMTLMQSGGQQASSQAALRTVVALKTQIDTIQSAVQDCILRYPEGDPVYQPLNAEQGYQHPYPLNPGELYLASRLTGVASILVENIACPGDIREAGGAGQDGETSNNHRKIFSGDRFMPAKPDLFGPWRYYNGSEGVFIWTGSSNTDSFLESAMTKVQDEYGSCQVDLVDATRGAVDLNRIDGLDDGIVCSSGQRCLRYWLRYLPQESGTHQIPECL